MCLLARSAGGGAKAQLKAGKGVWPGDSNPAPCFVAEPHPLLQPSLPPTPSTSPRLQRGPGSWLSGWNQAQAQASLLQLPQQAGKLRRGLAGRLQPVGEEGRIKPPVRSSPSLAAPCWGPVQDGRDGFQVEGVARGIRGLPTFCSDQQAGRCAPVPPGYWNGPLEGSACRSCLKSER